NHIIPDHSHPFALKALVISGQMWLTVNAVEQALQPGDVFELSHSQPHAERYGPEGASYLVARRHQP
ncbi:MAG: AraC family transcriptional regulator, partial [Betaproteobacteria bacterium]|nr:AraC family transcriptional regulator [Betaproteobacteria bacterium]